MRKKVSYLSFSYIKDMLKSSHFHIRKNDNKHFNLKSQVAQKLLHSAFVTKCMLNFSTKKKKKSPSTNWIKHVQASWDIFTKLSLSKDECTENEDKVKNKRRRSRLNTSFVNYFILTF